MTFKRIEQIDTETGEIIGNALAVIARKHYNAFTDGWIAMAQPALKLLAKSDLTGEDFRVLLMLLAYLDFENFIVLNQTELAKEMGMQRTHLNRSLKRLERMEIIIEGPKAGTSKTYLLNANYGWKGSAKNHKNIIKLDQKKKGTKAPKK